MKKLGRKIYRSTAPWAVKAAAISIVVVAITLNYFYFHLYISPATLLLVLAPATYYGLIRGITFHENGIVINRGLPFFNHIIEYEQLESYQIVHPKYLLSLKRKDTEEEILFAVRQIDRAIALLDQHLLVNVK